MGHAHLRIQGLGLGQKNNICSGQWRILRVLCFACKIAIVGELLYGIIINS